jgi:hypothetical protein
MNAIELLESKEITLKLNWQNTPSIQRLLDVICFILVEEYIVTAKQNPDVFLKNGDIK